MCVGHSWGYMDVQGVQYSFVPSSITADTYVLVTVHLLRCPIVLEPLFNKNVHSVFPCDLYVAGEGTGETGQATGDNQTTVITTKLRPSVDEILVQQRISTEDRQTGDQSPVT